ncbi:alcohol dehydrogenase [Bacillus sp. FJAT-27916]|uniref:iron-containing alcohol dehydrogenase n=1 Tax=Bacillus sp. FJAT-27916 TaxID=1679169 RepID=UPI0006713CB3|nr:iron-containing alcohol dehydrogenase [Bacillus sp. FJAT-27916]KMY44358.1 alcohol dehydrogenase [Bacillus sp. FJAT-27916]
MKKTSYYEFTHRSNIRSGAGTHILVPDLIHALGGRRPVLYSDKGLTQAGLTKKIERLFEMAPGIQLAGVFDDVTQDAKSSNINNGLKYFKECNGDSLIAIGGGSVLDTAKAIKWCLHKNVKKIEEALAGNVLEVWPEAVHMGIPHISIATTAGTGAEISGISVVFNEMLGVKCNLLNPFINSDIAILDPELTIGLPPKITAFTGMDALTHAIEGYFSNKSNAMADAFALHSAKMIRDNLHTAVSDGQNREARANMLQASAMAITSFALAFSTLPIHNMAHALGAKYGIPHGFANAVLMPSVMKHLAPLYLPKVKEFAHVFGIKEIPETDEQCLEQCINEIISLRRSVNLPDDFAEYEIDEADVKEIVKAVQNDPSGQAFRIPEEVIMAVCKEVLGTKVRV